MKAVFIAYNQSITEEVQEILDNQSIRGYTQWTETFGRGSVKGDMHEGTHTWPEMNNVHLTIVEEKKARLKSICLEHRKDNLRKRQLKFWP